MTNKKEKGRLSKFKTPSEHTPLYIRVGIGNAIKAILRKEEIGPYVLADRLGCTSTQIYRWKNGMCAPSLAWMIRILRRFPYAGRYLNWNVIRIEGKHDAKADLLGEDSTYHDHMRGGSRVAKEPEPNQGEGQGDPEPDAEEEN